MLYQDACLPPDGEDAAAHLLPFQQRVESYPDRELANALPGEPASLPAGYRPWWDTRILDPTRPSASRLNVDVDGLVLGALSYSPHVLAIATETDIRQTAVLEESGVFDWRAFIKQNYDDLSDPVGNLLTTGGPPRYNDNHWKGDYGVRRRTGSGGELELAQRLGFQNTNSKFFVPNNQGTARLEISYTQPLLNRFGRTYNNSRIVVAQIDANVARDEFKGSVQDHLYRVAQAYWELYRARALYLQKQKLLASALSILETLQARERVDAVHRQVLRARAAVASRRSEITQAEMSIRNSESQLRLLVNDPCLLNTTQTELVPVDVPHADCLPVSLRQSLHAALVNRPDVAAAIRDIRAAGVRLGIAENELLPKLDLILNVYSAGLEGDQQIFQAFANQFGVLEPGYTVGVLLEVPLGNNTARAQQQRRALELRRELLEFHSTVETGLTEVELAVRTLETSYQVLMSKYQAMLAASEEASYLERRWRLLPQDAITTAQLLEEMLDAQERVADAGSRLCNRTDHVRVVHGAVEAFDGHSAAVDSQHAAGRTG